MQNIQKESTKLFYHTCHIPLAVYDHRLQMLCAYGLIMPPLDVLGNINLAEETRTMKMSYKNIMTPFQEHYMLMKIAGIDVPESETAVSERTTSHDDGAAASVNINDSDAACYLLAGPFLHKSKDFSVEKLLRKKQIPATYANAVQAYFAELPNIAAMDVPYYYQLLERLFQVPDGQFSNPDADLFPSAEIESLMLECMGIDFTRHSYYYEQEHMKPLLSDADLAASAKSLERTMLVSGTLASNEDRQLKNLAIILVSLMGRFAIENGLDPHPSFTLMDTYLRIVEDCSNTSNLAIVLTDCARKLQKALKHSRNSAYSSAVRRTLTYIDSHLSSRITLEDAAEHVHLNACYLSVLFKKETGEAFSTCLMRKRIEEAQKMMDYTDFTLQNISDTLCFSSKSHFCKRFKEFTGMTPSQYKERKK